MSPHRSRKYRSPLNAWNVSASPSSPLPVERKVSSKPFSTKLRYGKDPGRQLKSPVTTVGKPSSRSFVILRRISSLPFAQARLLMWSRCVFRCRKERPGETNRYAFRGLQAPRTPGSEGSILPTDSSLPAAQEPSVEFRAVVARGAGREVVFPDSAGGSKSA
jgi:hypothetical protein